MQRIKTFRPMIFATLCFAALATLIAPAAGQDDANEHLFTIYNIQVDETARSASRAKQIALQKAEQEAFDKLLKRLTLEENLARFQMPEGFKPSDYVLGLEVVEERNSAVRYIGTFNITFDMQKIEDLLGFQNIPYVGFAPRPVLVLPLYWKEGAPLLWEEGNLFHDAWMSANSDNNITRYIVPEGTIAERAAISAAQVWTGRQPSELAALKTRYGADSILVASAKFIRNTKGGLEQLVITLKHPDTGQEESTRTYPVAGVLSEKDYLVEVARDIIESEARDWKARALTQFGVENEMPLVVPIDSTEDWAKTLARLDEVSVIRDVSVVRIALPDSYIAITYVGSAEQLGLALRQKGLILQPLGRGYALILAEDAESIIATRGE